MPRDDIVYPGKWAIASKAPWPGSPLQQSNNTNFSSGYTQSVKLPGLTTPSGNYYQAGGATLHPANVTAHTPPQKWPWW